MSYLIAAVVVLWIFLLALDVVFTSKSNVSNVPIADPVEPCPPVPGASPHKWIPTPIDEETTKLKCNRCGKFAGDL